MLDNNNKALTVEAKAKNNNNNNIQDNVYGAVIMVHLMNVERRHSVLRHTAADPRPSQTT